MKKSFISRRQVLAAPALLAAGQAPARPNILFVFADDLGWRDVGYQGSDFYETPNLDRFARQNLVFTQAYACGANCAPSRACLLSGQYTPRHGIYAVQSTLRGPQEKMRLQPIPNQETLAPNKITFAESMRAAGYRTGHFGKWHLGTSPGSAPRDQGFDVSYDPRPNPNQRRDEPEDPKGIYSLTRAVGDFMEAPSEKPFLAYLAHHAIHTALEARPASLARFREKAKGKQHGNPLYAACLYDLDDGFGQLLARLEKSGLAKNTVVIFTSDNGGTQQSSQEPLRGNKGCYYEGGIREPLAVRWPGVTQAATQCDEPVANVDFYPTFLDLAGGRKATDYPLDGESLVPLLRGKKKLQRDALYWHFPGYLDDPVIRGRDRDFRTRPVSVIRKGDWKLLLFHEEWQLDGGASRIETNNAVEVYNLREDPGERNNLAGTQKKKRDELLRDLMAWMQKVDAPLPRDANPAFRSA